MRLNICITPAFLALTFCLISGCAGTGQIAANHRIGTVAGIQEPTSYLSKELSRLLNSISNEKISPPFRYSIYEALILVANDQLNDGSKKLNASLKLDPANSYLQFFNAFTYHLMAERGDKQKLELAEQGYLLAVRFDASNWIARYFLATMYFEQRKFSAAKNQWGHVLLSIGEDQEVLLRLAASAYYDGDPITAAACLERLHLLSPSEPQLLRLSALVSAAINQPELAEKWLALYAQNYLSIEDYRQLQQRIKDWASIYKQNASPSTRGSIQVQSENIAHDSADQDFRMIQTQGSTFPDLMRSQRDQGNYMGIRPEVQQPGTAVVNDKDPESRKMVLVDVVIMRTEDSLSTLKGVNLLNALTLQYGGNGNPAYAKNVSLNSSNQSDYVSTTTQLTRQITIPALTYSLNIVNSNTNLNEMLARPTIAALNGVKSEFFSGTTLTAAVISNNSSGGGSVQVEKEIGVKLSILPIFVDKNKIRMAVDAQRTFVKPPSSDVNYTYKLETSKIMVSANVVMSFGETLVLGGLSEKETTNLRDGVPILQDIPGVQYFFSSKKTDDFQRSVLMLITPRDPQYTYRREVGLGNIDVERNDIDDSDVNGESSIRELRARYGDWFMPYPNMASVFSQLNSSSMYREFRTGDVTLEKWDRQKTTGERLKLALDFLFY